MLHIDSPSRRARVVGDYLPDGTHIAARRNETAEQLHARAARTYRRRRLLPKLLLLINDWQRWLSDRRPRSVWIGPKVIRRGCGCGKGKNKGGHHVYLWPGWTDAMGERGLVWAGEPWPRRWRYERGGRWGGRLVYHDAPGCGCIIALKSAANAAIKRIGTYYEAHV